MYNQVFAAINKLLGIKLKTAEPTGPKFVETGKVYGRSKRKILPEKKYRLLRF